MKGIKLFFLFFTLLQINTIISYRCGTDSIKKKPHKIGDKNIDDKRKLNYYYRPIKIKVDYTYLISQNILSSRNLEDLKNLFDKTILYISKLFSVIHSKIRIEKSEIEEYCEIPLYSSDIETILYTNDLLIFPVINSDMGDYVLAQAWTCLILTSNMRPLVGIVEISDNFSLDKSDTSNYMKFLLLHELSHVLGFHPYYFEELNMIYTERKNGITRDYINSTKVMEKAKLHFNCNNLKGVELENQGEDGSLGSHWEARYMLGDYMISTDYIENTISDITLAFFEDTGLYKVNYYTGGLFRFGKNQGCTFLKEDCIRNNATLFPNEFCTEPEGYFCGSSHISRGDCYVFSYDYPLDGRFRYYNDKYMGGFEPADYCPVSFNFYVQELEEQYNYPFNCNHGAGLYESIGEIIGSNSVCFESSLDPKNLYELDYLISICYQVECDKTNRQIIVHIGDSTITCPGKRTLLDNPNGIVGQIQCPNYDIICTSDIWCNDLFDCIDKNSLADLNTYDYNKRANNGVINLTLNMFSIILKMIVIYLF